MKVLPDFARREILTGLQKLMVLRLESSPAAESVEAVARVWMEAMASLPTYWNEAQDMGRIEQAFVVLIRDVERFPAPRDLIRRLPPRPEPRELPPPQMTKEEFQAVLERMNKALKPLLGKKIINRQE